MEGKVPQMEDSAWAKADWLLGFCLLQPCYLSFLPLLTLSWPLSFFIPPNVFPFQALAFVFQASPWRMPQPVVGILLAGLCC